MYDTLDRLRSFKTEFYQSTYDFFLSAYHYNADGDMDTLSRYWSTQNDYIAYEYNEYHNPVAQYFLYLDSSRNVTWKGRTQEFTYEFYYDTIQVNAPVNTLPTVLYPNPAGNAITVRWNKNKPIGPVHIYLYTTLGQGARHYYINTTKAEENLDLSGLSSGIYHMQILTPGGGSIYSGNICVNSQ